MDSHDFFNRLDAKLNDAINDRGRPHDETRHIFAELRRMFREVLDDSGVNEGVQLDNRGRRVDLDTRPFAPAPAPATDLNPDIERRRGRRTVLAGGRVLYPDEPSQTFDDQGRPLRRHDGDAYAWRHPLAVEEPPPAPLTGHSVNPPAVINDPMRPTDGSPAVPGPTDRTVVVPSKDLLASERERTSTERSSTGMAGDGLAFPVKPQPGTTVPASTLPPSTAVQSKRDDTVTSASALPANTPVTVAADGSYTHDLPAGLGLDLPLVNRSPISPAPVV